MISFVKFVGAFTVFNSCILLYMSQVGYGAKGTFGVYSFVVAGLLAGFTLLSIAEHATNLRNERK
jgi:hypothetical protein